MSTVEPLHNGSLGDRRKWPLQRDVNKIECMDCPSGRYSRGSTVCDFGIYWNRGIIKKKYKGDHQR